jgi:phenylalanyl-tRNA synthetase beta chain
MRVSMRWLSELVDLPTSDVGELTRAFDYLGHQVEDIIHYTADWTDVVVGRVESIEPHPDGDQVRVTRVDVGDGSLHQIICGAWNFDEGAVVPVALPGAVLAGGFEIASRRIRGVESNGMICSEGELGLGDDQAGIMVLDPDVPIGVAFASVLELPDVVFDIDVTTNRPDVMGMVGVARELAAWFGIPYGRPETKLDPVAGAPDVAVTISAPDGCNRFVAREIRGITVGPSPLWMRQRLRKAGQRPISNVVDVTNYVMLEMGHPLHAFDADRVAGGRLDVRWATGGEVIVTLDDATRRLSSEDLVIADADGPTSLAAVMGGARSEVVEETKRVLMEAASWNPAVVMHTSRRHDLQSEASARFQRGVDPNLAPQANARASRLLAEVAGGEVLEEAIDIVAKRFDPVTIELPITEVHRLLDDTFTVERCARLLRRLDLGVTESTGFLSVEVPTYRGDLTRPVDLVEEVARLADYDTFPATVPTGPAGGLSVEQRRLRRLHETLRGLGLHQVINLPFVSETELEEFASAESAGVVAVRNPLRDDQSKLRQSLLPALLRDMRDNRNRGAASVAVFETGRTFFDTPAGDDPRLPHQPVRLGVAITGPFGPLALGRPAPDADAATAFAVLRAVGDVLGVHLDRRKASPSGLHPTRSAEVLHGGQVVGVAGELHPDIAERLAILGRVAVLEVAVEPLVAETPTRQMAPLSTYPHVDFDLSFDIPEGLAGADLLEATSGASSLVESAEVFDEYRTPDGMYRQAIRFRLRAGDRTLSADEIAAERDAMIAAAARLGATLRGAG